MGYCCLLAYFNCCHFYLSLKSIFFKIPHFLDKSTRIWYRIWCYSDDWVINLFDKVRSNFPYNYLIFLIETLWILDKIAFLNSEEYLTETYQSCSISFSSCQNRNELSFSRLLQTETGILCLKFENISILADKITSLNKYY